MTAKQHSTLKFMKDYAFFVDGKFVALPVKDIALNTRVANNLVKMGLLVKNASDVTGYFNYSITQRGYTVA